MGGGSASSGGLRREALRSRGKSPSPLPTPHASLAHCSSQNAPAWPAPAAVGVGETRSVTLAFFARLTSVRTNPVYD
jgi:hypothetical protein